MRFSYEKDFTVKIEDSVIASSLACDMNHCLLANAILGHVAKHVPAKSFKVSAVPNGAIVTTKSEDSVLNYEYAFDRLTLVRINNFDHTYDKAIASGKSEAEAQEEARRATKPFTARVKFFGKKSHTARTADSVKRENARRKELAEGRVQGIIPEPTPRPIRVKKTGRRELRMGLSKKDKKAA